MDQQDFTQADHSNDVDEGGGGGGGINSTLIWIAALIGINVCSAIFDWPFWIY